MNAWTATGTRAAQDVDDQTREFAAYLATRPDLCSLSQCADMAAVGRGLAPRSARDIHRVVEEELGRSWTAAFERFDETPLAVNAATQVHAAVLAGGDNVLVTVSATCTPRVRALESTVASWPDGPPSRQLARMTLSEFEADRLHAANAVSQRSAWQALAQHPFSAVWPAGVVEHLSTPRLLVLHRVEGVPLVESRAEDPATARALSAAWFTDALLGRPFAVEPLGRWTVALPDGVLVRAGGTLDVLPPVCAQRLRMYLLCVAADEPDRACGVLAELVQQLTPSGKLRLARELRQFVPARDWKWPGCRRPVALADQVLGYWRAAIAAKARVPRHLLSFFRGVFGLARDLAPLDAEGQAIAAGFHDAMVIVGVERTRSLFTVDGFRVTALEMTQLAATLPRGVDDVLSGTAADRSSAAEDDTWTQVRRIDLSMIVVWGVLLLALARQLALWWRQPGG